DPGLQQTVQRHRLHRMPRGDIADVAIGPTRIGNEVQQSLMGCIGSARITTSAAGAPMSDRIDTELALSAPHARRLRGHSSPTGSSTPTVTAGTAVQAAARGEDLPTWVVVTDALFDPSNCDCGGLLIRSKRQPFRSSARALIATESNHFNQGG